MEEEKRSTELKDIFEENILQHYGVSVNDGAPGVGSGRYPLGSGSASYQHRKNFQTTVRALRAKGWDDNQIAKHLQMNSTQFRAEISRSKNEVLAYERALAKKLKDKGMSTTAIAIRMYKDPKKESTVRNLLKDANARQQLIFDNTKKALLDELEKSPFLDVGKGSELYLGVTGDKLGKVLKALEKDGYKVYSDIRVAQLGTDNPDAYTNVKVLTKGEFSKQDVYDHLEQVHPPMTYTEDGGKTFRKIEPPVSIDGKRVFIRYAEDGGISKDGTIEIRPGVEDLSLGGAHYAQVRIGVNGTHYLKGMALYSDDVPDGYDIVFNTNKHRGTPMEKVLKEMKVEPVEGNSASKVFGASIKEEGDPRLILAKQRHYIDENGEERLSAINIVNEEGNYKEWSNTIAAQMLSKQPHALAKRQLDLTYQLKKEQFDDLMSLTNPTVKKALLEKFADGCDSDAVHLQAFGFPKQNWKVILPVDAIPNDQIYCPDLPNGTKVALIRFPHSSIHEIPSLTVNNDIPAARKVLGNDPIDGVGINSHVAQHLSGADFDGDTVIVIPNNRGEIQSRPQYKELEGIDLEAKYPKYPGMKVMKEEHKQKKMGEVTNLIADMTILGATDDELVRAITHSMVVIDAVKHELDWKRSERENGILELKRKYQLKDDGTRGAGTLLTRAKSPYYLTEKKGYYKIDPETGKKVFVQTGNEKRTKKHYRMEMVEDARELISEHNSRIENVYAQYANNMKALALEARKAAMATPLLKKDKEAARIYADEVASLMVKLREAKMNKPLERQAQILANVAVKQYVYDNPNIANRPGDLKKLKGRTLQEKRVVTGANKKKVTFTENEWKAVQAGAVSDNTLKQLLNNADDKHVKQLSMPRERATLSSSKSSLVRNYLGKGYTIDQVAQMLDVPVSQVKKVSAESR